MLPALIWKLLSWIWYTFFSKNTKKNTNAAPTAPKCPISGQAQTDQLVCPSATATKAEAPVPVEKPASTITDTATMACTDENGR